MDSEGGAPPPSAASLPTGGRYEFHTDKWAELYAKRIDDMIAALKTKGVPMMWVGLPAIRGTKSTSDMSYLDELYRARADKAGITYVDIWDGFVDDQGRYVQGPDFEGQTRRLRTYDGVYFTKAGAEKLGHYVEHDLRRVLASHVLPVALTGSRGAGAESAMRLASIRMSGRSMPLAAGGGGEGGDLFGATAVRRRSPQPIRWRRRCSAGATRSPRPPAAPTISAGRAPVLMPNATADCGPLPGPEHVGAYGWAPKKGADTKEAVTANLPKASGEKSKAAPDQGATKQRRSSGASLDGTRGEPKDVGGEFYDGEIVSADIISADIIFATIGSATLWQSKPESAVAPEVQAVASALQ